MTDGTFTGALRAVLPHAGGAKAIKAGLSWIILTDRTVMATDRYTMARCQFEPASHQVGEEPFYIPPSQARLLLSLKDITLRTTSKGGHTLLVEHKFGSMALGSAEDEHKVHRSIEHLLSRWSTAPTDPEGMVYDPRYLSRFTHASLRGAKVEFFPHGKRKPTYFTAGPVMDGAIQPAAQSVR